MKAIKYFEELEDFLAKYSSGKFLLFIAEETKFDIRDIKSSSLELCGAIFPQIIFNDNNYTKGVVTYDLESHRTILVENIKEHDLKKEDFSNIDSMFTIVDGLSPSISFFLDELFDIQDTKTEIIGGGAGKLTLKQEPVIFNNSGIFQDSALLVILEKELSLGVKHGWNYLQGPFVATSLDKNILHQINFKPAFEVYKEVVEEDSNRSFEKEDFFCLAKAYPLGIVKYEGESIVRDPIAVDGNSLILVGEMSENSVINILKGEPKSLISSAKKAVKEARKKTENKIESVVLFSCISRVLYLEDDFKAEIEAIKEENINETVFGALTLGEIANEGDVYINFFNKTCVVGIIC